MDIGTPFKDLKLNNMLLSMCEVAIECNNGTYRLYVDKLPTKYTFHALAVEVASYTGDDMWNCPNLTVEPLFNVTAYFDGVRHLEFNREGGDMAGYIHYPNMQGLIDMMQVVREIEGEICRD